MLRKTKVNLLYAMMRHSKKFYSMSANVSNCGVAHRVNSAERRLARAQYPSTGHYVFIADGVLTSDHRVVGSSPAECKSSPIADLRTIRQPENLA
jgi:hypothetical protein